MTADAIRLAEADNVATVLRPIAAGELLRVRGPGGESELRAAEAIPLCHKISLHPIAAGEPVVKYGEPIGRALADIPAGRHVHVHVMRSARGLPAAGSAP